MINNDNQHLGVYLSWGAPKNAFKWYEFLRNWWILDHTCEITTNTSSLPSNEDSFVVGVHIFECYWQACLQSRGAKNHLK